MFFGEEDDFALNKLFVMSAATPRPARAHLLSMQRNAATRLRYGIGK